MKIDICHHFWKDRANAQWFPARFPYPQIEQEIKREYPLLVSERPDWKTWDNIPVFFDYRPEQDIYGRDIVPVSFAFLPDCRDPAACSRLISPVLARARASTQTIEVEIPKEYLNHEKRLPWKPGVLAVGAVLLCIGVIGIWAGRSPKNRANQASETPISQPMQNPGVAVPDAPAPGSDKAQNAVELAEPSTPSVAPEAAPMHHICQESWIAALPECPKIYVQQICKSSKPKAPLDRFERWRENQEKCKGFTAFPRKQLWEGKITDPNGKEIHLYGQALTAQQIKLLREALQLREP